MAKKKDEGGLRPDEWPVMATQKMVEDAHKFTFLALQYPEHSAAQLVALFKQMPDMDTNAAIWTAIDLGFIEKPNKDAKNGKIVVKNPPKEWAFGDNVNRLYDTIWYCFTKLYEEEKDLEENYLMAWLSGYIAHDILVALKWLIADQRIAQYEIEDGENAYDFFTLWESREQLWGRKQFKNDPLAQPKRKPKK